MMMVSDFGFQRIKEWNWVDINAASSATTVSNFKHTSWLRHSF